ncbi:hypothetical protein ACH5RR_013949 [Cinchona calisaya]|uniref:Uncharacterized protein n=1 Tax=Cinchona calisaya TaxID=153742 RepID=A0ABD3A451_9GENT
MDKNVSTGGCSTGMNLCYCKNRLIEESNDQKKSVASCRAPVIKMFDGLAARLVTGFTAAFFTSLERCYCMYIDTKDDSADDGGEWTLIDNNVSLKPEK